MCEFPSAAMVSNRCWSVMINKMSGRIICHSERSEESLISSKSADATKPEMFRFAQHDSAILLDSLVGGDLAARQPAKCFNILGGGFFDDFFRQTRRGRSFVPVKRLQIIAHKLFVETGRALPNRVLVLRPEARGIWRQAFVD